MKQAMQAERVSGFKEFVDDVQNNRFPAHQHIIKAADGLIGAFVDAVDSGG